MLCHRSPRPPAKAWKPGICESERESANLRRCHSRPNERVVADTAVGLLGSCVSSLGSASLGARSADEGEVILMSNRWAFTRRELATSGQFVSSVVWRRGSHARPGRGGRQRQTVGARNRRARARVVGLDLENVPTELVSPTGRHRAANICPREPSRALGVWPTVAGRLPGYSCAGGFEFSHFSPQNLDGKSGVPPPGRNMPRAQRRRLGQPCARRECQNGDGPGWMVWGDKHCLACLAPPWQGRRQP